MAEALEAGYDLAALALLFVALALLLITKQLAEAIGGAMDVSILGHRPFHFVAHAIENGLIGALDGAITGVEKGTAKFESGLIDSFGMLIAIPLLLADGTKAALSYLWNHQLRPLIHSIVDTVKTTAESALHKVTALAGTVADNLVHAEAYARARAVAALGDAEAYTDDAIRAAKHVLRADIAAGVSEAERYAETAVGKLRAAEEEAIAGALAAAAAAKAAGLAAASAAERAAEQFGETALSAAERAEAAARAGADAAIDQALAGVKGIAVGAESELDTLLGDLSAAGAAGLLASIPLLATLVQTIVTEAGLDTASCRGKVKNVCSTDPALWEQLLGGLLPLGFAFSLEELASVARPILGGLESVIREAA